MTVPTNAPKNAPKNAPTTKPNSRNPFVTVDQLLEFLRGEAARPGERPGLSALDHGLQCAHELSLSRPDDSELQIAGLLHDIGHRLVPGDDAGHGRHGAAVLQPLLGERVAELVALHVPAKRYLVSTDPAYQSVLSAVSIDTLARQGGPMPALERDEFDRLAHADAALELRRADDRAKTAGREVPGLESWVSLLALLATRNVLR